MTERDRQLGVVPDAGNASNAGEFIDQLHLLRLWAGKPSYGELSKRARRQGAGPLPISTLSDLFRSNRLPRWEVVAALVSAVGGTTADIEVWRTAWVRLAEADQRENVRSTRRRRHHTDVIPGTAPIEDKAPPIDEPSPTAPVSMMFSNLTELTQKTTDRLLRLVDVLEQDEQNPDRLQTLFELDHLVARLRRRTEGLLVLAGFRPVQTWPNPQALADIMLAAIAEVEQYYRINRQILVDPQIEGRAIPDLIHLTAELLENATNFSPSTTEVSLKVRPASAGTGDIVIEIKDEGIGLSADRLEEVNNRISSPFEFGSDLSSTMGIYLVAALAARQGVGVELRREPSGSVTSIIYLPASMIVRPIVES